MNASTLVQKLWNYCDVQGYVIRALEKRGFIRQLVRAG
jgi:hypothetical protein